MVLKSPLWASPANTSIPPSPFETSAAWASPLRPLTLRHPRACLQWQIDPTKLEGGSDLPIQTSFGGDFLLPHWVLKTAGMF